MYNRIVKLNPKKAIVRSFKGQYKVPYSIILPQEDKIPDIGVDRLSMYVDKIVKFKDNKSAFIQGNITKLNIKTAKINVNGTIWTVPYANIVKA